MTRSTLRARTFTASAAFVGISCAAALLATGSGASGATTPGPEDRVSTRPNVSYPLPTGSQSSTERAADRTLPTRGVELHDACGTPVLAVTPGRVALTPSASAGANGLQVVTGPGHTVTSYGYLGSVTAVAGQIVQSGQQIGTVGDLGDARGTCKLRFEATSQDGANRFYAWTYLALYVGKPMPDSQLFGSSGFTIATFNTLGASHTAPGGDAPSYPSYTGRTTKTIALLNSKGVDIAGLQEFQKVQYRQMKAQAGATFGFWPPTEGSDTENSIAYRKSTIEFVRGSFIAVPYFNGSTRYMPYAELRQRSTGKTVWVINVHNPGNTYRYPNQEAWRAKAIEIERQNVVRLRATGRPVFLTGDLNDRELAYCPLATNKLAISPDAVPSMTCLMPPKPWIDWIIAAGPVRFTTFARDWYSRDAKISDHPIVTSRAHIAE